jgi:hypothetical protein
MKYVIVTVVIAAIFLKLPSEAAARPHEDTATSRQEDRTPHREGRDDARGPFEHKTGDNHPSEPRREEQPAPSKSPIEQAVALKYQQHLKQRQDAARASRKDSRKDAKTWNDGRSLRAEQHRQDTTRALGNIADRSDLKAELATHADRMARLNRALDVAEDKADSSLIARTNELIRREIARDAQVIAAIKAKAGAP